MTGQFLTYRDVVSRLRRSRSAIEADIKAGLFPPPALFGRNAVWPSVEIDAFAASVAAGVDSESLKKLVIELIQERPARAAAARAAAIGGSTK
jgi:predicted DNA-binding transcriptional regulator AlpA